MNDTTFQLVKSFGSYIMCMLFFQSKGLKIVTWLRENYMKEWETAATWKLPNFLQSVLEMMDHML